MPGQLGDLISDGRKITPQAGGEKKAEGSHGAQADATCPTTGCQIIDDHPLGSNLPCYGDDFQLSRLDL